MPVMDTRDGETIDGGYVCVCNLAIQLDFTIGYIIISTINL